MRLPGGFLDAQMDRTSVKSRNDVWRLKIAGNIIELLMGDFPWPGLIAKG